MYKVCKTEQSALRQWELEQGLLALMNQHRYEDISVSDLCAFMQIPRKSFYRYFSSKDGALYALLDHTMMEYDSFPGAYESGEKRTVQRDLEGFFLFWKLKKPLLDALKKSGMTGVLIERSLEHVHDTMFPTRFLGEMEKWEQEHVVTFSVCGLMVMMTNWHQGGYTRSVRDMAKVACRVLSQPLYPNADKLI